MRKILPLFYIFVFLFLNLNPTNVHTQTPIVKDSVMNLLTKFKTEANVKSMIAGVWDGDREILKVAMGESITTVPADINMHFHIGGVTETFMGTLLMMLVDQGKINLSDKISKWLPDMLSADEVNVGMLIKNTAGYKDYVLNEKFVDLIIKEPFRFITREEIYNYSMSDGQMNFSPGTDQKYSHTEFTILGEVMEKATGKTMSELYNEYIFEPMDLNNTGHTLSADLPFPVLHSFTYDRGVYEDATYWSPSWTGESGAIYSNIEDLGKWSQIFGKGKLLTPESFEILVSPPESIGMANKYFASGFGVVNGWFMQNPSFNGYSGAFGYLPKKELSIIIYTTQTEDPKSDGQAFQILLKLIKELTPDTPLDF